MIRRTERTAISWFVVKSNQRRGNGGRLKLEYQTIDISDDPAAIEALRALSYYSVPIVMVDNGSNIVGWTGFRPDKIKDLVNS